MEVYQINALQKHKNKQERAYDEIKSAIVNCSLMPREQLIIRNLANQLQISEIPVREALKRLISGNFVVEKNSNLYVAPISASEFIDMLDVKLGLEVLAIRLTAKRINEEKLSKLRILINEMLSEYNDNHLDIYKELHNKFHLTLCNMCGVSYLIKAIEDAFSHHERGLNYYKLEIWENHPSIEEHKAIVNALEIRDADTAEKCLTKNRIRAAELYKRKMQNFL